MPVPWRYLDSRKFHFEHLTLIPLRFRKELGGYGVEAKEEGLVVYKLEFCLYVNFVGEKRNFFPLSFKLSSATLSARNFVQDFNAFFERKKHDFIKRCPLFFDWTDLHL